MGTILSLIQIHFRYAPDADAILTIIQIQLLDPVQIRSRHGRHSFSHTNSVPRYSSMEFQTRIPFRYSFFWPIALWVNKHSWMASLSPSPARLYRLQMASLSPFSTSQCWYYTMRVQIYGHSSVQLSSTFGSRKARKPIYILRFKKI